MGDMSWVCKVAFEEICSCLPDDILYVNTKQ